MNTRFLETFVVLAQLRNFRATARALNATPAAVSMRIKSLEDDLGTELVDRSAKGFRLTPGGEILLGYAKTVVAAAQKMLAAAGGDHRLQGRVRMGVIETVVHSWLSTFMNRMAVDYPDLEIDLTVDTSLVLRKRLLDRELDLVVRVEGIEDPRIVSLPLAVYPVQWIARRGFLSLRPQGLVKRLLQHPILTFARGTQPQRVLEELLVTVAAKVDLPLERTRLTCSPSVAAIVELVKAGYGVAAIPSLFVRNYLDTGEFIELPVPVALPPYVVNLCLWGEAETKAHATAATIRKACLGYSNRTSKRFLRPLC
jgi:DNA-binding transcriptional LysR family regulator